MGVNLKNLDRNIIIDSEINSDLKNDICNKLMDFSKKSFKPINIYLSTNGGCFYNGLGIIDTVNLIRKYGIRINMIASGTIFSMGAIIFLSNPKKYRFITKNTTVLIHEIRGTIEGTHNVINSENDEITRLNKKMQKIILSNLNISKKYLLKKINNKEWYLDYKEFIKLGGGKLLNSPKNLLSAKEKKKLKLLKKLEKMN